ncbi:MAG: hypothetical protein A2268_08235 [Candidatus Raymondbacteria bacterium RifOxyA12_full_50_37]|nr:MAG: hypothetical protein A2268_08235 [Candidatus Raymondbacteria bacterium RifOxyA12_full_50_37]OGJ93491.1 MAG: hypothetical protein A2248_08945 [Candidatus Raymondbacteria bacterium RIFOXYA2_FULL_49_16]OGK00244.1 MAG: hypothetical protein A2487_14395 [Candidatus Raymondbacteria bacterium RifOxyC12_full_50_8]OGP45610.1 MAG: hypothetical protein A2324_04545 [Candidatus Raymondbacteria bacterium RIFOXYB2_FULL_49_35]
MLQKGILHFFILLVGFGIVFAQDFNWTWPAQGVFNRDHFIQAYVDHNGHDYRGGTITYTGHDGIDFYIYTPKQMDRGDTIYAVADGYVQQTDYDNSYDRPYHGLNGHNNSITIIHNDTLMCWYSHCRYRSCMVAPGDSVRQGQPLAFIASAGYSLYPHVHFEITEPEQSVGVKWDPFDESGGRHYWTTTPVYAGDAFGVREFGLYTQTGLGFAWNSAYENAVPAVFTAKMDSAKLHAPKVFGIDEPFLVAYWNTQNAPYNNDLMLRIIDPRDSVFYSQTYSSAGYSIRKMRAITFASQVNASLFGTWKAEICTGGVALRTNFFTVGATSVYGPLFSPVAGISFRVGELAAYQLAVDSLSNSVTYTLGESTTAFEVRAAPTYSYLYMGNGAQSDQPYRNRIVSVVASNSTGFTDTFHVHLVDFAKPVEGFTHVQSVPQVASNNGRLLIFANPYAPGMPIMTQSGSIEGSVQVFDIAGRVVRRLKPGSAGMFVWDGRAQDGAVLPAGLFVIRSRINGLDRNQKIVLLP